jgi:hypothetical protein
VYTGPISVTRTTTLRALATASGMANSTVASATYTIRVAPPTFSPASGTYVSSVQVTIADSTPGATIYYTTDGSTPTTASTVYTGPIPVTRTTTLRALAAASGMANSTVASATYTIRVASPTFSPAGGTYVGSVTVTLGDATSGATIYYTTDGSTPTTASTVYTGPISLTQTTTLRALATASGMANSTVASATYTVAANSADVTAPILSLPGNITVKATSFLGAVVTFSVSATDNVDTSPTVRCSPPSGSLFPVGVRTVACTATDDAGNVGSGSFLVTVLGL